MTSAVWDVDVLFGFWPERRLDMGLATVRATLAACSVERAWATSARGAIFDAASGNHETVSDLAGDPVLRPVGTVDLRDALACDDQLGYLREQGVRALRLFPDRQGAEPGFPGFRHVVSRAVEDGFVILVEGDVRRLAAGFRGLGATVVFLDVHAYHVADFVLLCREEPGFVASTRLLNAPDSIERVVAEVGSERLVYGSRTPLHYPSPPRLRLADARLSDEDRGRIATRNLEALLEGGPR